MRPANQSTRPKTRTSSEDRGQNHAGKSPSIDSSSPVPLTRITRATVGAKNCGVKEESPTKKKTLIGQTEKVGNQQENTVLAPVEEALSEKTENVGTETPVGGENAPGVETAVKKKVRIVKKIVKKKVIKKIPKRVSVTSDSNEQVKVENSNSNPNPNDSTPMEIEAFELLEVEKPNDDVDDLKKVEDMQEFEVSEREKGVSLIKNVSMAEEVSVGVESCRNACDMNDLVTASLLKGQNQIDQNNKHDNKETDVEGHESEEGDDELEKSSRMEVGVSNDFEDEDSVKEKGEYVGVKMDSGLSNDVEGEEGVKEQVENREAIDIKLSEAVEGQEGVMEVLERQKRQSMEIAIGGLDKETKEEDIRQLFEEVGEVIEVRLAKDGKTEKCKGFGFIRYASAADAQSALTKYHSVEICGKQCGTVAVEGDDTIFLSNIDKKWTSEYVLAMLQEIGIEKIDRVLFGADSKNIELNSGFAFLEFKTRKDAQTAYDKLQREDVFRKRVNIKVEWDEHLVEPDTKEMQDIKSVYAEHIPFSWDEDEVREYFEVFGEIESIALAKNLRSTKRKDFAFINYKSREAALACIEASTGEMLTTKNGSKVHVKVSLAKSMPKEKRIKPLTKSAVSGFTEVSKVKQRAKQAGFKSQKPRNVRASSISRHEDARLDKGSSTTAELVQLLREQASWKQARPGASTAHLQPSPRGKRPPAELESESLYHDPRAYHRARLESHNVAHSRSISNGVPMTSVPYYSQQRTNYTSGTFNGVEADPRYFQSREQVPYHRSNNIYRRMP